MATVNVIQTAIYTVCQQSEDLTCFAEYTESWFLHGRVLRVHAFADACTVTWVVCRYAWLLVTEAFHPRPRGDGELRGMRSPVPACRRFVCVFFIHRPCKSTPGRHGWLGCHRCSSVLGPYDYGINSWITSIAGPWPARLLSAIKLMSSTPSLPPPQL